MALTPEQKQQVSQWAAAGDNLSAIQSKLSTEFQVSMTYMDVRFLVDDLNLELKDPKVAVNPKDVSKHQTAAAAPSAAEGQTTKGPVGPGATADADGEEALPPDFEDDDPTLADDALPPAGLSKVTISLDRVVLIPGAMASGTATFSDGVTAKWIVDQYGRPGFTEVSQPGYRPTPEDAQEFMQELSMALQRQGY